MEDERNQSDDLLAGTNLGTRLQKIRDRKLEEHEQEKLRPAREFMEAVIKAAEEAPKDAEFVMVPISIQGTSSVSVRAIYETAERNGMSISENGSTTIVYLPRRGR